MTAYEAIDFNELLNRLDEAGFARLVEQIMDNSNWTKGGIHNRKRINKSKLRKSLKLTDLEFDKLMVKAREFVEANI